MIAPDTNVLVRLLTGDDPAQFKAASAAIRDEDLWLCKTVLLETEWVLRFSYRFSREAILGGFRKLLGYERLHVEDRDSVLKALFWYSQGLDFADALHLASSAEVDRFVTFDHSMAKAGKGLEKAPVVDLLPSQS